MSEYIGSRISLVSKSDIRYVGKLHEINSETATVALEQVRSFGTEGRKGNPEEEIPGSDNVYEYIVFRGSDVKDLRIEEPAPAPKENKPPQIPNDPAILGSGARPPAQNGQQPQHMQPPQQGFPGNQGPPFQQRPPMPYQQYNQFQNQRFAGGPQGSPQPGYPGPGYPGYAGMPYGPPPGFFPPGQGYPPAGPPFPQQQQMPFGGPPPPGQQPPLPEQPGEPTKPTPPATMSDAPSSDPAQAHVPPQPSSAKADSKQTTPMPATQAKGVPPPPPIESKPDVAEALAPPSAEAAKANQTGPKAGRVIPAVPLTNTGLKRGPQPSAAKQPSTTNQGQAAADAAIQYQNATQAATAAVQAAMAKLPPPKQGESGGGIENLTQKVNNMRMDDRTRNPRQTAGYAGGHRGARSNRGRGRGVEVPTTDFDFEQANAKFNKESLAKEAIATGELTKDGADESAETVTEAGPSADGAADVIIPAAPAASSLYNKSSFFDNISSEAKDREEASAGRRGGGEFRSEERKRNMETFGMGSVDGGYRGGYRGRGRGRGYRGGYRGFNRGGYRGRGDTQTNGS